jgi:hypothetical protein
MAVIMKVNLTIAAAILISAQVSLAETGAELLDKLIAAPGSYSQVCDLLTVSQEIPFKAFQIQDYAGAYFSDSNLALMKARRGEVVEAVRKRLGEIDLTREPVTPKADPKATKEELEMAECYGADPLSMNSFLFEIIRQTAATEAMPELLALETRLVDAIAKAKEGGNPPEVSGWYAAMIGENYDENEPEAKRDRRSKLNRSRIAQRDLVTLIATLMRGEKYAPYLATDFEKAYVAGLRKQAKEAGYPTLAADAEIPKKLSELAVVRDPISGILCDKYQQVEIAYSRPLRDGVRAAAEKWITEH